MGLNNQAPANPQLNTQSPYPMAVNPEVAAEVEKAKKKEKKELEKAALNNVSLLRDDPDR